MNNRTRPVPAHSLRHNLIQHRVLAACISGALALAAMPALAQPVNPDQQIGSLALGDAVNAEKVVYSASNDIAMLGKVIEMDGWQFRSSSPEDVPNSPETILYFSASDNSIDLKKWQNFVASFQGVLIVDSDALNSATENTKTISSDADISDIVPAWETISPASEFYNRLSSNIKGPSGGMSIDGTAVIANLRNGSMQSYTLDYSGKINGSSEVLVDLQHHRSLNATQSKQQLNKRTYYFDFVTDGWRAAWQTNVEVLPGRELIVDIWTGDSTTNCYVNNKKCGIYPINPGDIFTVTRDSNNIARSVGIASGFISQVEIQHANMQASFPLDSTYQDRLEDETREIKYRDWDWNAFMTIWDPISFIQEYINQGQRVSRARSALWSGRSLTEPRAATSTLPQRINMTLDVQRKWRFIPSTIVGMRSGWGTSTPANFEAALRIHSLDTDYANRGCTPQWSAAKSAYSGFNPGQMLKVGLHGQSSTYTHRVVTRMIYDREKANYRFVPNNSGSALTGDVKCGDNWLSNGVWRNTQIGTTDHRVLVVPNERLRTQEAGIINISESAIVRMNLH